MAIEALAKNDLIHNEQRFRQSLATLLGICCFFFAAKLSDKLRLYSQRLAKMGVSRERACLKILKLPTVSLEFAQESRKNPETFPELGHERVWVPENEMMTSATTITAWEHGMGEHQPTNVTLVPHLFIHLESIYTLAVTCWWLTYPSEKYESQMGLFFPIYGKIKNVPNHQPDMLVYPFSYIPQEASPTWYSYSQQT